MDKIILEKILNGDTHDFFGLTVLIAASVIMLIIRWLYDIHKNNKSSKDLNEKVDKGFDVMHKDFAELKTRSEHNKASIDLANKRLELIHMMTIDWNKGEREKVIDYMYRDYVKLGGDSYVVDENGSIGEYHRYKDRCKELKKVRDEGVHSSLA